MSSLPDGTQHLHLLMIASGFGDRLGKYIALADWQLGHLLWDEPFDAEICQPVQTALQSCVDHAGAIGQASPEGLQALLDELIESGLRQPEND